MSAARPSRRCKASYIILLAVLLLTAAAILLHLRIKRQITELCRYKCAEAVNRMITETVSELPPPDSSYYRIKYDSSGKIVSASADSASLNELQNRIRAGLNTKLSSAAYDTMTVALGDLTEIELFSGRGPELSIGFQQSGLVSTELVSSFEHAGIDQTRFRASVLITVEFKALLPSGSEVITVEHEYIAADVLVVGEVPAVYLDPSV